MSAQIEPDAQYGARKKALTATTSTAAGGCLTWLNPEGVDLIITKFILDITTIAAGNAAVDAGVASTVASADNLLDGQDVHAAIGAFGNPAGSNGKPVRRWNANEYITVTASASLAGLVGNAYVEYIRV